MEVSLQAGRVVGEHWRLQRRLGGDVASRFWEAEDLRGGAHVAIEFAYADLAGPDARLRFSRETRALLKFRHPNVARTLHRGIAGDSLAFAVTELMRGEDLVARLAREPALGLHETAQILDVVCRVVNRLEASNIPQRVLEPKQVFFAVEPLAQAERGVKLLHVASTHTAPRFGSPYVSPERAGSAAGVARGDVDGAAQVWAIGVLGYRMLAGELPFAPGTRELDSEWASRLARLGEHPGDLPPELDEWFRTAIHPDPTQRFGSVEQAGLAFGHIATTYASRTVRVHRERPQLREAAGGSVVMGVVKMTAATRGTGRAADESGVVRVALAQAAVPASSTPPAPDVREQFPLGRIPEPPSLAKRRPEPSARPALRQERSRQPAAIALAVVLGMVGGFVLRSAIVFVEEHAHAAAALRGAPPPHAVTPFAPQPTTPLQTPSSASQPPAAVAEPAPPSEAPALEPATDSTVRPTSPRDVRPAKRAPREATEPAEPLEPVESANRPLVSSRTAPPRSQLAEAHEFPRGPSERIDALLPAAPAPLDTTPLQVYRGF